MKYFFIFISLFLTISLDAQTCDPNTLIILQTRARDTDAAIPWKLKQHHSFYNPSCVSQNTLVLHLVGSFDNPSSTLLFPSVAANSGFDVVSLEYPNDTAAKTACNNSSDPACYAKFRREILEGVDYSPEVTVDVTNSVYNRLIKLLQYLDTNNPTQNWGNYYSGNTLLWNKIIVSGHSQGGGHAAIIAKDNLIKRALMFASPNDYSTFFTSPAPWTLLSSTTPDSSYYGFNNQIDDIVDFSEQFAIWGNLGMPAFGDTVDIDNTSYPYNNSRQLYTKLDATGFGSDHSNMILDSKTPLDINGNPLFEPVWKYMLGITSSPTFIQNNSDSQKYLNIFPNPSQNKITLNTNLSDYYTLEIYTILGELKTQFNLLNQKTLSINISTLKSGVYLIKITTQQGKIINKKFIKQ